MQQTEGNNLGCLLWFYSVSLSVKDYMANYETYKSSKAPNQTLRGPMKKPLISDGVFLRGFIQGVNPDDKLALLKVQIYKHILKARETRETGYYLKSRTSEFQACINDSSIEVIWRDESSEEDNTYCSKKQKEKLCFKG